MVSFRQVHLMRVPKLEMRPIKQKPINGCFSENDLEIKRQVKERKKVLNRMSAAATRLRRSRQIQDLEDLIERLTGENELLKAENVAIKRRVASETSIGELSSDVIMRTLLQ